MSLNESLSATVGPIPGGIRHLSTEKKLNAGNGPIESDRETNSASHELIFVEFKLMA
jgi:hypothetical protein